MQMKSLNWKAASDVFCCKNIAIAWWQRRQFFWQIWQIILAINQVFKVYYYYLKGWEKDQSYFVSANKKVHSLGPAFRGVVANSSSSVVTPSRTPSSPYPMIHTCPLRGFSVSNQKQAGLEDALAGNYEKKTIPLFLNDAKIGRGLLSTLALRCYDGLILKRSGGNWSKLVSWIRTICGQSLCDLQIQKMDCTKY